MSTFDKLYIDGRCLQGSNISFTGSITPIFQRPVGSHARALFNIGCKDLMELTLVCELN